MCLRLVHLLLHSGISQEQVLILLYGFWRPSILVEVERPRSIECRILHSCEVSVQDTARLLPLGRRVSTLLLSGARWPRWCPR